MLRLRPVVLFLVGIVVLCGSGCGKGSLDTIPVKGTVTYQNTPLKTGSIVFHPDATKGNKSKEQPVGTIAENGSYTIATGNQTGAPPGWYKVTVVSTAPSNPNDEYSLPRSLISKRYEQVASTPLSVEVKEEGGSYDLNLTRK